jgi:hypothetical protein
VAGGLVGGSSFGVNAACPFDSDGPDGPAVPTLFAGGDFTIAGQVSAGRVAELDGCAPAASCYANCDNSTTPPVLNVIDFACFLNKYASGDPYANCDQSTTPPILNVLDFACFLNKFAAGCP